ncbi:SOS response associated peptidase (SRAP) [Halomonas daqiaonensis]|uniref:Abasic site processing protein n=1 Tax=Halomonas daqiaonensis TaxID=650850 RepID=A0A1H7RZ05_9GAMM|nr:SOS response associated peptidase (SRAP) [Halomonas daqiaonensis]
MCGRFVLYSDFPKLSASLKLSLADPEQLLTPCYNVAPGTFITAVRRPDADSQLTLDELRWGYGPHWADDKAPQPINATVERVATSNYFKGAFARHRCLVPADGWYEWVPVDGKKLPHFL